MAEGARLEGCREFDHRDRSWCHGLPYAVLLRVMSTWAEGELALLEDRDVVRVCVIAQKRIGNLRANYFGDDIMQNVGLAHITWSPLSLAGLADCQPCLHAGWLSSCETRHQIQQIPTQRTMRISKTKYSDNFNLPSLVHWWIGARVYVSRESSCDLWSKRPQVVALIVDDRTVSIGDESEGYVIRSDQFLHRSIARFSRQSDHRCRSTELK